MKEPKPGQRDRSFPKEYRFTVRAVGDRSFPDPWSGGPVFRTRSDAWDHIQNLNGVYRYVLVMHTSEVIT